VEENGYSGNILLFFSWAVLSTSLQRLVDLGPGEEYWLSKTVRTPVSEVNDISTMPSRLKSANSMKGIGAEPTWPLVSEVATN